MKALRNLMLGLLVCLWPAVALADGLIVITEPIPVPDGRPVVVPRHRFAPLNITYHKVTVTIKDQVAVTAVDQEFYNPNNARLEGHYIFPIPKDAQIDKFEMDVNGKMMAAELLDATKARKIYEDIVRQARDPALMEYVGRGMFRVRIFPIEPNSKKRVRLKYTELLKNDSGMVSYSYPLNTERFSAQPIQTVSMKIEIDTTHPMKSLYCPSHKVEIKRKSDRQAVIGFEESNTLPDTDFQLFYSVEARQDIALNLLTYHDGEDDKGYFLLLAAPGSRVRDAEIVKKDVVLLVDTSGSMAGKKLEQAVEAMKFCTANLNDGDRFEVVRFSTEADPLFGELVDVTADSRDKAIQFVDQFKATGGTAIEEALLMALKPLQARANPDRPYVVIFLTDGRPTIGNTKEDEIVAAVAKATGAPGAPGVAGGAGNATARIFSFGIGTEINTHLLDKITETTRAASQYVLPEEDIEIKVSNFYAKISSPVLSNVELAVGGDVRFEQKYPTNLPDLFNGDQMVLLGRYTGHGEVALTLAGTVNGKPRTIVEEVTFPQGGEAADLAFVPRLWATRRVGFLLDETRLRGEDRELLDEITRLARRYGIVTPYTSYLILEDEEQRRVPAIARAMPPMAADAFDDDGQPGRRSNRSSSRSGVMGRAGPVSQTERKAALEQFGMAFRGGSGRGGREGAAAARDAAGSSRLRYAETAADAFAADRVARGPRGAGAMRGAIRYQSGIDEAAELDLEPAVKKLLAEAESRRFVAGRTFYKNGEIWVDARVAEKPNAKRVEVAFASAEYFKLFDKYPRARAWLALGSKVHLFLGDTIYEIVDES